MCVEYIVANPNSATLLEICLSYLTLENFC
jgi:hypothetical protein